VVPLVLAGAALLFGPSLEVLQVAECVFFALGNMAVGWIAMRYFRDKRVTAMTMLLYLGFTPAYGWFCHIFSEPIFTPLLALLIAVWTMQSRSRTLPGFLGLGVAAAVNALCRPEMYALAPILAIDAWRGTEPRQRRLAAVALLTAGFMLLEIPWFVRNCVSVGRPVVTATAGIQNTFRATWYTAQNWQGNVDHDPAVFPMDPKVFWALPEMERDRLFEQWTTDNLRNAPLQVAMCVPKRAWMFFYQLGPTGWMPSTKTLLFGTLIYALAALGYRWSSPQQRRLLNRCLWVIAVNAAVHALVTSDYRFSHPMQPYFFLMASVAAAGLLDRWAARRGPESQTV
jgi:hypothetical protein